MIIRYLTPAGFISALSILSSSPVFADSVTSLVVAYDRVANRVVLEDNTVFSFDPAGVEIPITLSAGDEVTITFQSSEEEGIEQIDSIVIVTEGYSE